MKPLIRNLLRMSVYQLKWMDAVPDSAVVNEAVKIAQKRGFFNLKGFVNGVLRACARGLDSVTYPSAEARRRQVRWSICRCAIPCRSGF